jgi:hypothetical protein
VHDTTGGQSVAFDAERNDGTGSDPFQGYPAWRTLENFPWRSLQVVHMDLCTTQPCTR